MTLKAKKRKLTKNRILKKVEGLLYDVSYGMDYEEAKFEFLEWLNREWAMSK